MNTSKQITVMIVMLAVLVVSCGAYAVWEPFRKERAVEWQEEVRALRGANLFVQNCRICHGIQGEGGIGPALDRPEMRPTDPTERRLTRELIINTLICGRVGTPMPPWSQTQGGPLNNAQLEQLATLILTGRWDLVVELGRHADETTAKLARDISATDTVIPVTGATMPDTNESIFAKDTLIRIGFEQMKIIADPRPDALQVQRGANNTRAEAHRAGASVFNAPTPPDPAPINQQACGQGRPPLEQPPPGEIYIQNFLYNPANYQAKVGDRVTWTNKDSVPHTVTTDPQVPSTYPVQVDSGLMNQNATFSHTFTQPGVFNYYCTIHPYMKGSVTVTP